MRLSTDLDVFFGPEHFALAARLPEQADHVAAIDDARAVATALGADHDLYRLFAGADDIDLRSVCLVREALGYASPLADSIYAVHGLGTYPIVLAGTDAHKRELLPACRDGRRIGAFALTEPEAGSDVASMKTRARNTSDGFVLDGDKTFISNVGIADHYVVFANADPDAGRHGISAFLVPADAPGLTLEPFQVGYDHPIGGLQLRECRVPGTALLGQLGGGFQLAMRTLDGFRVSVGAAAVGMAARALDEAIAQVRARVQFGKPLAEQAMVQSHLADMATELDAARLLVYRAAHAKDRGHDVTRAAAMAKLYATEAAFRIVDTAVQLFGGRGVKSGEVVEGLYRAIRPLRIYEGTSEIQRLIIGRGIARG